MSIESPHTSSESQKQLNLPSNAPSVTRRNGVDAVSLSMRARLAWFTANQPGPTVNSFCGAVAGVASGIVTCPLDVIKTKLQGQRGYRPRNEVASAVNGKPAYSGMFGTASMIWRQDGLRGMYRGLGPMLMGYLPTWAVYMSVYGAARDYYYTRYGRSGPTIVLGLN